MQQYAILLLYFKWQRRETADRLVRSERDRFERPSDPRRRMARRLHQQEA